MQLRKVNDLLNTIDLTAQQIAGQDRELLAETERIRQAVEDIEKGNQSFGR